MLLVLLKPSVCFVSEMPDHNENRRNSLYAGLKAEPDQEHRILTSQKHKQPGKAVRILKDKGGTCRWMKWKLLCQNFSALLSVPADEGQLPS